MADSQTDEAVDTSQDTEIETDVFDEETEGEDKQDKPDADEAEKDESTKDEDEEFESEDESAEADDTDDDEAEESEDESQEDDAETKKQHNAEMAQRRIAEKQARLAQEERVAQEQQKYVEEAETDADRLVRTIEVERYQNTVKANEGQILTEFERIKSDPSLQMFNPDSKEFAPRLYGELQASFEAAHVQTDNFGNIVKVNASLYDKAKTWGDIWGKTAKVNQAKGQKNARKNMSKAEPPSNSPQKHAKKVDPTDPDPLWDED